MKVDMNQTVEFYNKHRAGAQDAAQSYHSYYLLLLALRLKKGEKIGFEIKDDIHIEKADGTNVFIQVKHSIQKNIHGNPINLTSLDNDLWGTLYNWLTLIQLPDFGNLKKCEFILLTNKGEGRIDFQDILNDFRSNENSDTSIFLKNISTVSTNNSLILDCINKFKELSQEDLSLFLNNLKIETEANNVIEKIKNEILIKCQNLEYVQVIFNSYCAEFQEKKYAEISQHGFYEISFDDFLTEFGHCMRPVYQSSPLPERKWDFELPDNIESQIFIQQLLDIEDIERGSEDIRKFTFQKMHAENVLSDWIENNEIYQVDLDRFEKDNINIWKNNHRSKFRNIARNIRGGVAIEDLEEEIKLLAVEIIDELRNKEMRVPGNTFSISVDASNGYLYLLSDELKIGWHYDWENRYKKI
jgi:hypothetical protein